MSATCAICNRELQWGGFAYNQEMCINCFQFKVEVILHNIKEFYVWDTQQDIDIVAHMFNVMAETYGYSNRIKEVRCFDK